MKKVIVLTCCLLMTRTGLAWYEYRADMTIRDCQAAGVTVLDSGDTHAMRTIGFGKEIPLLNAVNMMTPGDWNIVFEGIDPAARVSWQAGEDWLETLDNMIRRHGYCSVVDWSARRISFYIERMDE